jgi:2-C-methyl-D-erythritol 4-phosphate cytidylyltransferase
MGLSTAKQFLMVDGEPILARTLRIFENSPIIDEIVLVVPEAEISSVREMMGAAGAKKIAKIVPGGAQRQDSVQRGLEAADRVHDLVVIHDAVRPFLAPGLLADVVAAGRRHGAATLGIPAKDTIKEADGEGWIVGTLDRSRFWLTQTPQVFRRELLDRAFAAATEQSFTGTDDAVLAERIGVPVKIVPGSADNIKITTPEDLRFAEAFLRGRDGGQGRAG